MSIATLILGLSGTGKTTSLRNLDPSHTLLIQCLRKPMPFKGTGWKVRKSPKDSGNVIQTDQPATIEKVLRQSPHDVVIIDDYQAVLVNELMARADQKGFDKFIDIAKGAWNIFNAAGALADNRRVYIMAHTQTGDDGIARMKTVGRMVDEKIVPEGYFTIVLRTEVVNGEYFFTTQTNGQDCAKSPMGMFSDRQIPNDLKAVDEAICDFYQLNEPVTQ